VILGAGLDARAWRMPELAHARVFEVDYPATQAWKRERLKQAGLEMPPSLTFAPVDFERRSLADGCDGGSRAGGSAGRALAQSFRSA
jgi:O-methyltransferase involved in polyketide biosynthesis